MDVGDAEERETLGLMVDLLNWARERVDETVRLARDAGDAAYEVNAVELSTAWWSAMARAQLYLDALIDWTVRERDG